MVRQQINIKLPPELIEALREKASTEEVTLTELIQGYCEQGLGLPASKHQPVDTTLIYERILSEVDNRISTQLDIRIPELEEPLLSQLEERIAFVVDARILSQVALLEQRMATQLGEQIREGFSMACEVGKELGRELERSKQQSPLPTESAPPVASSTPAAKGKAPRVAPKSQRNKSGKKIRGTVKELVEEKILFGQQLEAVELADLLGLTPQGIGARRRAGEKGNAENLAEWGLKVVPDSAPYLYERI